MTEELHHKVDEVYSWIKDNGAWGAKTKLAQLWDWFSHRKEKDRENDRDMQELWGKVELKIDKAECQSRHDKLLAEIEKMLDSREAGWKYWVEQIKWLLPTAVLVTLYVMGKL